MKFFRLPILSLMLALTTATYANYRSIRVTYFFNTNFAGTTIGAFLGTSLPPGCGVNPFVVFCAKEYPASSVEPVDPDATPVIYRVKPGHESNYTAHKKPNPSFKRVNNVSK